MLIEKMKLNELISPDYNPRKITNTELKKLRRSIETYGYQDPLIINKKNKHIVAGNQRFKILNELNELDEYDFTEIEVVIVDIDENNEKSFNIAHNKIQGVFDDEKLNDIFIELDMEGFDTTLTGFDFNIDLPEITEQGGISKKTKPIKTDIETIQVIIDCENETEQEKLYLKLKKEGYKCQTLTL